MADTTHGRYLGLEDATALLAAIVASSSDAILSKALDGTLTSWNSACEPLLGYRAHEIIGQSIRCIIPPGRHAEEDAILERIARGEFIDHFETIRQRKDGSLVDVSVTISPVRDRTGVVIGASTILRDITDKKRAERQEAWLAAIVASSFDGIVSKTLSGEVTSWNASAERILGFTAEEMIGQSIRRIIPEDRQAEEDDILKRIAAGELIENFETVRQRMDGSLVDVGVTVSPIRDRTGAVIAASKIIRDITEQKRAKAQLEVLIREVNHRAHNMLAVVQAVARQSLAAGDKDLLQRFLARLQALSRNQDLLVRNEWRGVELAALVHEQVAPFADGNQSRIEIAGPAVLLLPQVVQSFGMALHELATNATKYGALSRERGRVAVNWRMDGERFSMEWSEQGGPPVSLPERRGYGSIVLTKLIAGSTGGDATMDYAVSGVTWRLTAPKDGLALS
jgi:PAS domain S-box-containing protein